MRKEKCACLFSCFFLKRPIWSIHHDDFDSLLESISLKFCIPFPCSGIDHTFTSNKFVREIILIARDTVKIVYVIVIVIN